MAYIYLGRSLPFTHLPLLILPTVFAYLLRFSILTMFTPLFTLAVSSLLISAYAAPMEEAAELLKRAGLAQVYTSCTASKTVALTFDDGPYIWESVRA